MTCTFFGSRYSSGEIRGILKDRIIGLIKKNNVTTFYVGNNGMFDGLVISVLKEIEQEFSRISFYVVLAYMPVQRGNFDYDTIYPETLANVPTRFAIKSRNMWMIEKSDFVITYATNSVGNAAKFKIIAEKKKKTVIDLLN